MEIYPTKRAKTCVKGLGEGQPHSVFLSFILGVAVTRPDLRDNPHLTECLWLEEKLINIFYLFC